MELTRTYKRIKAYAEQRGLPLIPVNAKSISLVKDPTAFYKILLNGIGRARSRVALSALYLGTGTKEQALLRALYDNLSKNTQLDVSITLDSNRATRRDGSGQSSVSLIRDMMEHKPYRLNLMSADFGPPSGLQKLLSKFQKLNELSSTYHSKLMVFDDQVIITGANLSSIYFEARQDRYVKIEDCKLLSNYVCEFLNRLQLPMNQPLKTLIDNYNRQYISDNLGGETSSDCYVIPLCQFGRHNVRECDDFLVFLNDLLQGQAEIHMSTGYFNPKIKIKLNSVIAPSEQANGFFGGNGLLKHVPRVYTALMSKYQNSNPNCELFLYNRPDWSYHAKGIWVHELNDLGVYMIGSSNFNWRSSERDFELQFMLLTNNPTLKQGFKQERDHLLAESTSHASTKSWPYTPIYTLAANLLKSLL